MSADEPVFEVFPDSSGAWRFRLVARNGEIVATASESYTRPRDARRAVETLKRLAAEADIRLVAHRDGPRR